MKNYHIIQASDYAEINISGMIGVGEGLVSAKQFMDDFDKMASIYGLVKIKMNSAGGSVQEGMQMYNAIKKSSARVETYCSGIVASMASVVFSAGAIRTMAVGSRMMIHQASVEGANGNASDLRDLAKAIDGVNEDMKAIYIAASGQPEKVVNSWMERGKNTWFNATECKKLNLCDAIDDNNKVGISIAFEPEAHKMVAAYHTLLTPKNPEMDKKLLTASLGLSETASDAEILAALQNLKNKNMELETTNATLKASAEVAQKARITALIDDAVKAGKITADVKPSFEILAQSNFEACKVAIDAINPAPMQVPSIAAMVAQAHGSAQASTNKDMTFSDWQKKNPDGLMAMHKNDFEKFSTLYKAEFGVVPEKY